MIGDAHFSQGRILISALELLPESRLGRIELLLLRRLCFLVSFGSFGLRPLARAERFRTSVRETTPDSFPDNESPGRDAAEMEGLGVTANGGRMLGSVVDGKGCGSAPVSAGGGTRTAG